MTKTKLCSSCKKELSNDEALCPHCGTVSSLDAYHDEIEEEAITELAGE